MVHVFSGKWPEPQLVPNLTEFDGKLTPVSEAKRREAFLRVIGNDHPLMNLIHQCIDNDPKRRPCSESIVDLLALEMEKDAVPFDNRLQMLSCIQGHRREIEDFRNKLVSREDEVNQGKQKIRDLTDKMKRLELYHSNCVEVCNLLVQYECNEKMQAQCERDEAKGRISQLESKVQQLESYNLSMKDFLQQAIEQLKSNKVSLACDKTRLSIPNISIL